MSGDVTDRSQSDKDKLQVVVKGCGVTESQQFTQVQCFFKGFEKNIKNSEKSKKHPKSF